MSQTLLAILGTLVVNGDLRRTMLTSNRDARVAALKERGFFVSYAEIEVVERMLSSFESGEVADACARIASECPDWPCSHFKIVADDGAAGA